MMSFAISAAAAATALIIGMVFVSQVLTSANTIIGTGTTSHTVPTTNVVTQMADNTASTTKYLNYTRPFIGENVNASSTLINKQINTLELQLGKNGSPTNTADAGVFRFTSTSSTGNATRMQDTTASASLGVSQADCIYQAIYFGPTTGVSTTLSPKMQLVVNAMTNHTSVCYVGIINPGNGPGASANQFYNWTYGNQRILQAGGQVFGYVYSNYTNRAQSSVIADVAKYQSFYPNQITGIFIDEMQNTNSQTVVDYYANLTRTIHNMGLPTTICNPGQDTRDIYINSCDKIMIEEGNGTVSYSRLQGTLSGNWWHNRAPQSQWIYSAYNMPTFNATSAKAHLENYVSGYYWTNGTGAGCPNSGVWNCVPAYIDQEFQVIESIQHTAGDRLRNSALEYFGPSSSVVGQTISNIRIPLQRTGTVLYGNYSIGVFYDNMTSKAQFGGGYAMDLPTTVTTLDFSKATTAKQVSTLYRVPYNASSLASRGMFNATGGTTIWGERAAVGSVLIGKSINNIEIIMQKEGTPTGIMTAGVFDSSGNVKFTFGTIDVSTIATAAHYYSFTNSTASYTVVQDDRIGVKYNTGGAGVNLVRVYEKNVDRFDSTNSYRERWNWDTQAYTALTGGDVVMDINKVTYTSVPSTYTIQSGDYIGVYYPWGNSTQYISTRADNSGGFDGTNSKFAANIGVPTSNSTRDQDLTLVQTGVTTYFTNVNKVKNFGTINVSSLTGSPANVTLTLAAGDNYTLLSGDFIGVRYNQTGLTSNDYVTVVVDTNASDPFDGSNSKYAEFRNGSPGSLTYTNTDDIDGALKLVTQGTTVVPGTATGDPAAVQNFTAAQGTIWSVVGILPIGLFFGLFNLMKRFGVS